MHTPWSRLARLACTGPLLAGAAAGCRATRRPVPAPAVSVVRTGPPATNALGAAEGVVLVAARDLHDPDQALYGMRVTLRAAGPAGAAGRVVADTATGADGWAAVGVVPAGRYVLAVGRPESLSEPLAVAVTVPGRCATVVEAYLRPVRFCYAQRRASDRGGRCPGPPPRVTVTTCG